MPPKDKAPDNGITYDDEGQPTGTAGDLARYHADRGEFAAAIKALADKVEPNKQTRTTRDGS